MRSSKQIGAAGMALLVGWSLAGCREEQPAQDANAPVVGNVAPVQPQRIELAPQPPLDREGLLLAAFKARSAAGVGADDRDAQQALDGRRFEFRMRLGCTIARPGVDGPFEARFDQEARRVDLRAAPDISLDDPFVAAIAGGRAEAAEGFWIKRPWLLALSCAAAGEQGLPEFGLVQFFTEQDPRSDRRGGRPYQIAAPLAEGAEAPSAGSWDLVLRGRLRKFGDDRVIQCRAPSEGARPVCLISLQFEHVSIEDVSTGQSLAEWGRG